MPKNEFVLLTLLGSKMPSIVCRASLFPTWDLEIRITEVKAFLAIGPSPARASSAGYAMQIQLVVPSVMQWHRSPARQALLLPG
ncbi:hypothetical protein GCM10009555_024420 [Acrocarpospora macrocephala]|uniref:Uncharacterized protein n=1 Tax=Acrocarpospora macrocephala TaxID=150177 RepID=A0A5M3X0W9_9ACTN|nr:hypothetical protein Amac_059700 [Acrocarpospora macrocephala]